VPDGGGDDDGIHDVGGTRGGAGEVEATVTLADQRQPVELYPKDGQATSGRCRRTTLSARIADLARTAASTHIGGYGLSTGERSELQSVTRSRWLHSAGRAADPRARAAGAGTLEVGIGLVAGARDNAELNIIRAES
jgi:hypothetical protein